MDNETSPEESLGDSSTFEVNSPYQSEDSRFSPNSFDSEEYPIEVNPHDWADDSSYDTVEHFEDMNYESVDLVLDEPRHVLFPPRAEGNLAVEEDIAVESLEENNNDPNNNMDSNEVTYMEEESIIMEQSSESGILIDRPDSPQPGCSKNSLPIFNGGERPPTEREIHERTQHILELISSIDADSVSKAIRKKPKTSIDDVKLWDLVPKSEKSNYPRISDVSRKTAASMVKSNVIAGNGAEAGSSTSDQNSVTIISTVKRGPVEDICTVGCKKSSSTPDIAILLPKLATTATTSKSPSQIPVVTGKPHSSMGTTPRGISGYHEKSLLRPNVFVAPAPNAQTHMIPQTQAAGVVTVGNTSKGAIPKVRTGMPKQVAPRHQDLARPMVSEQVSFAPGHTATNFAMNPAPRGSNIAHPYASNAATNARAGTAGNQPTITTTAPTTTQNSIPYQQPTNRTVCMEMYYKLRNIFPNVDPKYLKKLCPPEWGPGDRDAQVTPIVEYLLSKGDSLPPAPVQMREDDAAGTAPGSGMAYGNVDDVYENLLGIFPDADPHYLREFAEKNVAHPDAIKEFVELKLESRDYPTREQYRARLKITEQQRQYTTGFNVQQYLTIIPDPFTHFRDAKRKCAHSTVAFEFLKSYFSRIRVSTITKIYKQNTYNLSASAQALETVGPEMRTKRAGSEMPTEDILLLQEMAFIKHKAEITEYIENKRKAEEAEFIMLKENNFLVECQCCYDSECVPSKCSSCENGHLFCNSCIIAGTNTTLGDGGTRISCFTNCGSEISLSVLQQVLAPTTFSILLKKRQAAEVIEAGLEGLVSCPFCNFASIPPEEDKIFKCLNPECTKESCRLCKELSHVPLKCDEVMKADKARLYIEESMTAALARKCYQCQRAFFKEEGCNKIQCPCGALMCYLCDQPIKNYSHFRGQGSNDKNLCPLYSDTIRLDAVAVRRIAEEAQKEVMKKNPNIKIDTSKLLPKIPNATQGPHTTVLNADELPRRAQRVLDLNPL